jgi:hypothetical protein
MDNLKSRDHLISAFSFFWSGRRDSDPRLQPWQGCTLPLSYARKWCLGAESNHRHEDFQSSALPTELPRQMAELTGIEPAISGVTGRHVKPLHYSSPWWAVTGSNCRHPACKAGALPAELTTHLSNGQAIVYIFLSTLSTISFCI